MDKEPKTSVERFTGFADVYDKARPSPPVAIVDKLIQLSAVDRPEMVVDIGCGTGLSTRIWVNRVDKVIGIEPSEDMLRVARESTDEGSISFKKGFSHETGLDDNSADIVTCVQCLHWLEPESTFAEISRILRNGGVFAAIDCDWPPATSDWRADRAYMEFFKNVRSIDRDRKKSGSPERWRKSEHLERMERSGNFRYARKLLFHHTEMGNSERLKNLVMSFGATSSLMKQGYTESDIGLDRFREKVEEILGDEMKPWQFYYRVRVGIL